MTQISPPVGRAVSVLNFLAEHADQAFTLSEISKSLRISSATCHSLLTALTESGYIFRTAGKTYVLGPALVRVAQAALAPATVTQVARPEMRLLADEFDVICSSSLLVGNHIEVRGRAASVSNLEWQRQSHETFPAGPPFGAVFMAWKDPAAVEAWLHDQDARLSDEQRNQMVEGLAFLRAQGFSFGVRKAPLTDWHNARDLQRQTEMTDYGVSTIDPQQSYELAYVVAPVFQRSGVVAFVLSISGFAKAVSGESVQEMGSRLRAACDRIGSFIAGRDLF